MRWEAQGWDHCNSGVCVYMYVCCVVLDVAKWRMKMVQSLRMKEQWRQFEDIVVYVWKHDDSHKFLFHSLLFFFLGMYVACYDVHIATYAAWRVDTIYKRVHSELVMKEFTEWGKVYRWEMCRIRRFHPQISRTTASDIPIRFDRHRFIMSGHLHNSYKIWRHFYWQRIPNCGIWKYQQCCSLIVTFVAI